MKQPLLTKPEESDLLRKAQAGDIVARNTLVERNIGLLASAAIATFPKRDPDESIGIAAIAMMRSIRTCDPSIARLSTYSFKFMRREIQSHDFENRNAVRIGRNHIGRQAGYIKTPEVLEQLKIAMAPHSSLDADHKEGGTIGSRLADRELELPDEETELELARMRQAIENLPERHRDIIKQRLAGKTLQEIGDLIGLCKERVRQIEAKAHRMIREAMTGVLMEAC